MKIREYIAEDYATLAEMIMSLYREDPEGELMDMAKIDRTIEVLSTHPCKGSINVIQAEERVVGYGILIHQWSNEYGCDIVHIDELYIIPEYRSMGLGTMFINETIEKFKSNVLALEVTPSNERAKLYYESLGFKVAENRHLRHGL